MFLFLKIYLSRYLREIAALQGEDIRRHFAREGYLYGAAAGVFLRCFVDCLYVVLAYKKCSQQATADKETTVICQVLIKFTITASASVTAHASCCIFCRGRELTLNDQSQGSTITLNMTPTTVNIMFAEPLRLRFYLLSHQQQKSAVYLMLPPYHVHEPFNMGGE